MISDTEGWSNVCWKFSFAIIEINNILKIENSSFKFKFVCVYFTIFKPAPNCVCGSVKSEIEQLKKKTLM